MTEYNKLVRDKIPEILEEKNLKFSTHIADEKEFCKKLNEKLLEEVNEFLENSYEGEFIDVLEVLDEIKSFKKFDKKVLEKLKEKKSFERGNFKKRIILEEVRD